MGRGKHWSQEDKFTALLRGPFFGAAAQGTISCNPTSNPSNTRAAARRLH